MLSPKVGQGGSSQAEKRMVVSRLGYRKAWIGTGRALSPFLSQMIIYSKTALTL